MASLQILIHNTLCLIHLFVVCICSARGNTVYVMADEGFSIEEMHYWDLQGLSPQNAIDGNLVESQPSNACEPILQPPFPSNSSLKWFVLIHLLDCPVDVKLKMAENAGFYAVIAYTYMEYKNSSLKNDLPSDLFDRNLTITAVRVNQLDGERLRERYQYSSGYYVKIEPDDPFNIFRYIIPFVIAVGICMMILMLFVVVKYIRERRRNQRNRLSSRHLKQLPVIKFKKGDQYDVCAICLEEYNEGNKLRVLPCSHAYHTKCIDPWLTNNRRTCPICKRKIRLNNDSSDSESDSESEAPTETTPLLRSLAGRLALNRQRALSSNLLRNPVINSNQPDGIQSGSRSGGESSQTTYQIRPTLEQQAGPLLQHLVQAEPHTSESDNSSAYSSSAPPFLVTEDNEHEIQNQPSTSAEHTSSLPNIAPSTLSVEVTIENLGKDKVPKDMIV